jgi:hypothetical protein
MKVRERKRDREMFGMAVVSAPVTMVTTHPGSGCLARHAQLAHYRVSLFIATDIT